MESFSLNALRAFESAARTGSFVLAGVELGVTSAAVGQQVKALEVQCGRQLFLRQGNRISLTDAGRAIYPRLGAALAEIVEVAAEMRGARARARLVVSCLPMLADGWLVPRLAGYAGPGIELRVQDDPVDLARTGVDLRVTYGAHAYPDHRVAAVLRDRMVPVVAPGLRGALGDLPDAAFIHTDWGPATLTAPGWAEWWRIGGGRSAPDRSRGLSVSSAGLALAAARAGLGAALVPEAVAAGEVAAGRLRIAPGPALPLPRDYVLVWSHGSDSNRSLTRLVAHLQVNAASAEGRATALP